MSDAIEISKINAIKYCDPTPIPIGDSGTIRVLGFLSEQLDRSFVSFRVDHPRAGFSLLLNEAQFEALHAAVCLIADNMERHATETNNRLD